MEFYEIIGIIGVACILTAYTVLQLEIMESDNTNYLLLNLVGSLMMVFSLIYQWNLAGFILNVIWVIISLYSIYKKIFRKKINS